MFAKLKQESAVVEDESIRDGYTDTTYGSVLADLVMIQWIDCADPNEWINKDHELKSYFDSLFNQHCQTFQIELCRGTDYAPLYNLSEGDTIDYSNRYTSWTTDRLTALKFIDPEQPLLLLFDGTIRAFDLRRSYGRREQELIIEPRQFTVSKIIHLPKGKCLVVS